ncbi:hypothetical protein N0V86_004763 [Didymella sp. IMI 355093]|nr:hypothetical protein N0V86_004763 [Didymella sp. IMI 355093]
MEWELNLPFSEPEPIVEELSVLEYAREQGICVDYTTELPRYVDICLSLKDTIDPGLPDPFEHDLADAALAARELTKERLNLNKEAALILRTVLTLREPPVDDPLTADARQTRDLKQELPILQTDAELDMLQFGTKVEPDLRVIRTRLPSEDLDEENDEGFGWPAKYFTYPAQCDARIKSEKLGMTKDALMFLQNAVTDQFSAQDEEELMAEELKRNIDALFDAQDEQTTSSHFSDRILAIPKSKRKIEELRVEGPLTPEILSDSPMKKLKSVTFSDMIQVGETLQPWSEDLPSSTPHSVTEELTKQIEPIVKEANRKVENEKLTGADTISRVDIPVLDFTLPVAPWNEFSQRKDNKRRSDITELEAQMRFLQQVKRDDLKSATAWRGVSDLDLNWGWFASPSSTIKLNEKLHGETEFAKIQAELKTGHIATSENEIWKKDGLRVLDEDEEEDDGEDEIELAEFEECNDMEALIRKRKLELQEQEELLEAQQKRRQTVTVHQGFATYKQPQEERHGLTCQQGSPALWQDPHKSRHAPSTSRSQQSTVLPAQCKPVGKLESAPIELMFGGFSASTALHRFMETQGKAIESAKTTAQTHTSAALPAATISALNKPKCVESGMWKQDSISEHPSRDTSGPSSPLDLPPSFFIISSSLLLRRPFMKQIESLHPKAELIYRDYSLPHAAAAEADIILSPSTGVLLTTLQQIKQAPLPGQAARSPVKERMSALQERYERLVVLVSEGLRDDSGLTRPEDARDKETLKGLEVFASQLGGEVIVNYIRGGEATLARAVVDNMAKYGVPHGGEDIGDIKLFAMETTYPAMIRLYITPEPATQTIGTIGEVE